MDDVILLHQFKNIDDDVAHGKNVSGNPTHQHRYITVGEKPLFPLVKVELHSLGLGVSFSSPVALVSVELHS